MLKVYFSNCYMCGKKDLQLEDYPEHNVSLTYYLYLLCNVDWKHRFKRKLRYVVHEQVAESRLANNIHDFHERACLT